MKTAFTAATVLLLYYIFAPSNVAVSQETPYVERLNLVESRFYGNTTDGAVLKRVERLEKAILGKKQSGSIAKRLHRLEVTISGEPGSSVQNSAGSRDAEVAKNVHREEAKRESITRESAAATFGAPSVSPSPAPAPSSESSPLSSTSSPLSNVPQTAKSNAGTGASPAPRSSSSSANVLPPTAAEQTLDKMLDAKSQPITSNGADNSSATSFLKAGIEAVQQGDNTRAMTQFREAIRVDPDNIDAYFNLGAVLENENQLDAALQNYRKAAEINPKDADIATAIDQLQRRLDLQHNTYAPFRTVATPRLQGQVADLNSRLQRTEVALPSVPGGFSGTGQTGLVDTNSANSVHQLSAQHRHEMARKFGTAINLTLRTAAVFAGAAAGAYVGSSSYRAPIVSPYTSYHRDLCACNTTNMRPYTSQSYPYMYRTHHHHHH